MREERLNRKTLQDKYEDSLFAVLMDEFAKAEGKRLLEENEELKNDRNFQLPAGFEARSEKTISNAFAAKNRKETGKKAKRILSKIAIIVLFCGVMFITLFSTVSAFRETVCSILLKDEIVNTDISIAQVDNNAVEVPEGSYLPAWLPEGYFLISYERNTNKTKAVAVFSNKEGNEIKYYELTNEYNFGVDTEDADTTEKMKINSFDGMAVIKGSTISITWSDTDRHLLIRVKTENVDKETVIKIAESVKAY